MSLLTHEEAFGELAGVALGSVSKSSAERVRAHARSCSDCAAQLSEFEFTARKLGELVPEHPINPGRAAGIRSRLISRASADTDYRAVAVATSAAARLKPPAVQKTTTGSASRIADGAAERERPSGSPAGMTAVAGIAALIAAASLIQMLRANSEANSLRATLQIQSETTESGKPAEPLPADQENIIAAVTGPDVKVISLTHYGAAGAVGKIFWNRETDTWTLVTYSIRQPRHDKVFQVWLSTTSGKIPVGTFVPDPAGRAVVQHKIAVRRDGLYSVTVTEESKPGAPVPTGPAVIAGAP